MNIHFAGDILISHGIKALHARLLKESSHAAIIGLETKAVLLKRGIRKQLLQVLLSDSSCFLITVPHTGELSGLERAESIGKISPENDKRDSKLSGVFRKVEHLGAIFSNGSREDFDRGVRLCVLGNLGGGEGVERGVVGRVLPGLGVAEYVLVEEVVWQLVWGVGVAAGLDGI